MKSLIRFETFKRNVGVKGRKGSIIVNYEWQKLFKEINYHPDQPETPKQLVDQYLQKNNYYEDFGEFMYTVGNGTVNDDTKVIEIYYHESKL